MLRRLLHFLLAKPKPEIRHGLSWSIEEGPISGWAWTCLQCEGGRGSSPDLKRAREAADIHHLAAHTGVTS